MSDSKTPTDTVKTPATNKPNTVLEETTSGTVAQTTPPTHLFATSTLQNSIAPGLTLLREIARGGMGVVHAAHDSVLNRVVAVKVLLPGQSSQQFIVESQITAQLPHPGVPPVYALGELSDGRVFLSMKLIEGRTLAELLKDTRHAKPIGEWLGIFEPICQTVGFAHSRNIIHRDLKPSNIMVGAFGEVYVMDWGLARAVRADAPAEVTPADEIQNAAAAPEKTVAGAVKGTPAYMAPEQARGENVDLRADVFALGGILAVMLTGQPPFQGDTVLATVLMAAGAELEESFARLDSCNADPELVALCKRCLSPLAKDRPANGQEVAHAVSEYRRAVQQRLEHAERERAAQEIEAREQRKRRKVQLALVGSLAVLLLSAGGFFWWQERQVAERRNEKVQAEAKQLEVEAKEQQAAAQAAKSDAKAAQSEAALLRAKAETEQQQRADNERRARNREAIFALLTSAETGLRTNDVERVQTTIAEAETRLAEGGADDLRSRVNTTKQNLATLQELDSIENSFWTISDGNLVRLRALEPRVAKVFATHGIVPRTTTPAAAAKIINESPLRERLLTALEFWFVEGDPANNLEPVLAAADPDVVRNEIRTAKDRSAAMIEYLTKNPDATQPVWFAVAHGNDVDLDKRAREFLLRGANRTLPSHFAVLMALGGLENRKDIASARMSVAWYRAAVAVNPLNPAARNNLGVALMDAGDNINAAIEYREAIRLDQKYAQAYNNLGTAMLNLKEHTKAIAAYQKAIGLNPTYVNTHYNLGIAYHEIRDYKTAIKYYQEAIRLDDNLTRAHFNLGNTYHAAGDYPAAEAAFAAVIKRDPKNAKAHMNLGIARNARGDVESAIVAYKQAVKHDPNDELAYNALGLAYSSLNERKEAIAAYLEAIRANPKYAVAHYHLGLEYRLEGEAAAALTACQKAVEIDPEYAYAHGAIALLHMEAKRYNTAITAARKSVKLDPLHSNAHAILGVSSLEIGDIATARIAIHEAVRLDAKRWGPLLKRLPVDVAPAPREKGNSAPRQ